MPARLTRWPSRALFMAAALVLAFEEWVWDATSAVLRRIGRPPVLRQAERWIAGRPPAQAVALFVLPVLVVLPLKTVALAAFAHGRVIEGVALLAIDKVLATAVFARLWQLTEPALATYRGIRRGRDAFLRLRARLYRWLHRQPVYRRTRAALESLRRRGSRLRRLRGALRRQRQLALRRAR